jgi:hypothetical protein
MSMNSRHAAALALVGWYLMWPPEKCVDKSRSDLGACEMAYDTTADLTGWAQGRGFSTAEACNAFVVSIHKEITDLGNERKAAGIKCVSSAELRKAKETQTKPN